jgi:hypothetical protein
MPSFLHSFFPSFPPSLYLSVFFPSFLFPFSSFRLFLFFLPHPSLVYVPFPFFSSLLPFSLPCSFPLSYVLVWLTSKSGFGNFIQVKNDRKEGRKGAKKERRREGKKGERTEGGGGGGGASTSGMEGGRKEGRGCFLPSLGLVVSSRLERKKGRKGAKRKEVRRDGGKEGGEGGEFGTI